jgi:hypothetical protein
MVELTRRWPGVDQTLVKYLSIVVYLTRDWLNAGQVIIGQVMVEFNCWSIHGRVGQELTRSWPKAGQLLVKSWPSWPGVDQRLVNCWSSHGGVDQELTRSWTKAGQLLVKSWLSWPGVDQRLVNCWSSHGWVDQELTSLSWPKADQVLVQSRLSWPGVDQELTKGWSSNYLSSHGGVGHELNKSWSTYGASQWLVIDSYMQLGPPFNLYIVSMSCRADQVCIVV